MSGVFTTGQQAEAPSCDTQQTTCCIVGGGPAGAILALLLARQHVPVTLLETHRNFDRQFRGDTIHPSVMEILDEVGLAKKLHELPHAKVYGPTVVAANGSFAPIDLRRLKSQFPYIMLLPQTAFLEFITGEASKYPHFRLLMGANVQRLIDEDGAIRGIRYRMNDGWHDVRALLTVGADGRFSQIRHLAGVQPVKTSPPMDILWFRLPCLPEDPHLPSGLLASVGKGRILVVFKRYDYWQVGYVFPKRRYEELRAAGLEAMRRSILELEPQLAKHVEHLTDWRQFSLLSVESSRCLCWYKPGLLLIGDAAHVMSPIGGVGINYAIQDAVVAANVLTRPLQSGKLELRHLAAVQRQREWPTRFIQAAQSFMQRRILSDVLQGREEFRIPWYVRFFFRIPVVRDLPARVLAFGIKRVHVAKHISAQIE